MPVLAYSQILWYHTYAAYAIKMLYSLTRALSSFIA